MNRGKPVHFGADPKGKNFIYGASRCVVIRNVNDPLDSDVYTQHTADVGVAKYAPSGYYIASGDATGKVRIWDTVNKEHILKIELSVLSAPVTDLAWTEDSKRIVAVGDGRDRFGAAFMFDSGSSVGEISGHSKCVNSCDVKPNRPYRAITAGLDNLVNFFPGPPFKFAHSNKEHTRFVNCVRFSPDGSKIASASSDKRIYIYDGKSGEKISVLANEKEGGHTAGIYSLSWNGESTKVLTASADKTARIYDVESGKCETTFTFAEKPGVEHQQLGCLWMGDTLLSLSLGGVVSYLDPANPNKPKKQVFGHSKTVTALAYDKAANALFSGDLSGLVVRWNAATADNASLADAGNKGHSNSVKRIVVDGDTVITTAMDDTVRFAAREGSYTGSVSVQGLPSDLASNGGTAIVVTNQAIQVISGGKVTHTEKPDFTATSVAVNDGATAAAVGGEDGKIRIYGVSSGSLSLTRTLEGHRGAVTSVAYSPDGSKLASTCKARLVRVWNATDGSAIISDEWMFHSAPPLRVNWSPNSKRLITGGLDSDVFVWDLDNKSKRIHINQAHILGVTDCLFIDETTIATTGYDCTTRTWTLA